MPKENTNSTASSSSTATGFGPLDGNSHSRWRAREKRRGKSNSCKRLPSHGLRGSGVQLCASFTPSLSPPRHRLSHAHAHSSLALSVQCFASPQAGQLNHLPPAASSIAARTLSRRAISHASRGAGKDGHNVRCWPRPCVVASVNRRVTLEATIDKQPRSGIVSVDVEAQAVHYLASRQTIRISKAQSPGVATPSPQLGCPTACASVPWRAQPHRQLPAHKKWRPRAHDCF